MYEDFCIGNFRLTAEIDRDNHLNIYIETNDGTRPLEIETGRSTQKQLAFRFSTSAIEREHKK